MAPAPTMPNRSFSRWFLAGEVRYRIVNRVRDKIDVLVLVIFVPGEDQDVSQSLISAGKAVLAIFENVGSGQTERETAAAQSLLLAKDTTAEGRFLDVTGNAGNGAFLQPLSQRVAAAWDRVAVHAETIFPVGVDAAWINRRSGDRLQV